MAIKIFRSEVTATPPALVPGQLAYSELSGTLFIGLQAGTVLAIAGSLFAKLVDPAFTGNPTAPTQTAGNNSTRLATTEFVTAAVALAGGSSVWGGITGTLASQTDLIAALDAKAALASPTFTGTPSGPTAAPGTNTTQFASTAFVEAARVILAAATALKADIASPTFTGAPAAPTAAPGTNTTQVSTTAFVVAEIAARLASNDAMLYKGALDCSGNPNYPAASSGDTYRVSVAGKIGGASGLNVEIGDMFICHVDSSAAGNQATVGANWDVLQTNIDGAVTLTGIQTLTNKTLTAPVINSPTGIVKADVGLGSVDNTSDVGKPVSTAQQTALNLKANLAGPTFTGVPAAPTAAAATNTTQIATTAFVQAALDDGTF
jgi:hypothetical protein